MSTIALASVQFDGHDPLAETIARSLESDIIFGRLISGQKLREEELADRFRASRHQVREALGRLERGGIVVRERNRGAYVQSFSANDVREIYEIRELLQRQAALRIPLPVDETAIARLEAIQADYEQAIGNGDVQAIHSANDLFHTELFGLCGNERLAAMVKHYMDLTYVIRAVSFSEPERLEVSKRHHEIMIELLRGRDSWALAQLCIDHIQPSKAAYLHSLGLS